MSSQNDDERGSNEGNLGISQENRSRLAKSKGERVRASEIGGDGRQNEEFFASITEGSDGVPEGTPFECCHDIDVLDISDFAEVREQYERHFDQHIACSIPGFWELQAAVGSALCKWAPSRGYRRRVRMLDIGCSEGSFIKAVTAMSNGQIWTVGMEPNLSMFRTFHEQGQVVGANICLSAFGAYENEGEIAWKIALSDDETTNGIEVERTSTGLNALVRYFKPHRPYDIIHEAMTFQFISNKRSAHIRRCRELLSEKGLFFIEEKCITTSFADREIRKDEFKHQFFSDEQIIEKAQKIVGSSAGGLMHDRLVYDTELEQILCDEFAFVVKIWEACNFFGFIASDYLPSLQELLDHFPTDDVGLSRFTKIWIKGASVSTQPT